METRKIIFWYIGVSIECIIEKHYSENDDEENKYHIHVSEIINQSGNIRNDNRVMYEGIVEQFIKNSDFENLYYKSEITIPEEIY